MKFGGTSLKDSHMIKTVGKLVKDKIKDNYIPIVVCSAMGKTTGSLLKAGTSAQDESPSIASIEEVSKWSRNILESTIGYHLDTVRDLGLSSIDTIEINNLLNQIISQITGICLIREMSIKSRDLLLSYGERISVRIISFYLNYIGVLSCPIDAWDIGFITEKTRGDKGAPLLPTSEGAISVHLSTLISSKNDEIPIVPVITGFIGRDDTGRVTTLGRGGSDLTASIIGACIGASCVEIWTDVSGVYTADPRMVPSAYTIPSISFIEASELAYFGAKVLHPMAVAPAMKKNIPVIVKNTFHPEHPGTSIVSVSSCENKKVTAVTHKSQLIMIDLYSLDMLGQYGFLSRVFDVMSRYNLSVDVISTSEVSLSFTLDREVKEFELAGAVEELEKLSRVEYKRDMTMITLICHSEAHCVSVLADASKILNDLDIKVELVTLGASKVNVSYVICTTPHLLKILIEKLHTHFFS
eukprot:GHVR01133685.1.p1 GENE.GHVR01133685.1~~GHVR01133685.1.p1  ORF type:complete len:469 (-),score=96.10 GHVR01133685.1:38-1444(-)